MILLLYLLFIFSFLLLIINLIIYSSLNRVFQFRETTESSLNISVVVAAKNEVQNIPKLITALKNQSYGANKFEVIIVDDNSTDDTFNSADRLTLTSKTFSIIKAKDKIHSGKKGALDIGIKKAKYPYILITDADSVPAKDWIKSFAEKFNDGNDFLFGIAPYSKSKSITNLITRFENLRAHILMFSLANIGLPYSAAARSFGFSKDAFQKIYGYKNTTETLSGDDDLLLREAIKNNFKVGLVINKEAFVFTKSKNNFTDYVNQKSRHTSTSIYYSMKSKTILATWHLLNLVSIFSIILLPFNPLFLFPFFIKLVVDLFILNNFQNDFGYKINPLWFIILQINYELNLIYFFFKGLSFSNRWK
jgi:cellulose synthase/poly-beta-1,6-N-acetylglucosamine synthase-like glycosyltransferase